MIAKTDTDTTQRIVIEVPDPPSRTWWGEFFAMLGLRLHDYFIKDVPPELYACETCREVDCSQERWETCAVRIAKAEEIRRKKGRISHTTRRKPLE